MSKSPRRPSRRVTRQMAALIKGLLLQGHLQSRIAAYFDLNGGRVSEVKTGKRFPDVIPALPQELPKIG